MKDKRWIAIPVLAVLLAVLWLRPQETVTMPGNGDHATAVIPESSAEQVTDNDTVDTENLVAGDPACPPTDGEQRGSAEVHEIMQVAAARLQTSSDPEFKLAAGMILAYEDPARAFELMQEVAATTTGAALASWRTLILCSQRELALCESASVEDNAIRADRDNGMMWVQLASRRLKQGHEQDAIDAIRNAIAAPRFDTYFTDQVAVIDRGLAAVSSWSYAERIVHGSDNISVSPGDFGFIRERCRDVSSGVWTELCDLLGQRMIAENVDLQTKILGSGLRTDVMNNIGDVRGAADAERERTYLQSQQSMLGADDSILNLILSDDAVLRDYLENSDVYGEEEALRRLTDQAAMLRATPGYNQCNFLTNPYIKL